MVTTTTTTTVERVLLAQRSQSLDGHSKAAALAPGSRTRRILESLASPVAGGTPRSQHQRTDERERLGNALAHLENRLGRVVVSDLELNELDLVLVVAQAARETFVNGQKVRTHPHTESGSGRAEGGGSRGSEREVARSRGVEKPWLRTVRWLLEDENLLGRVHRPVRSSDDLLPPRPTLFIFES